MIAIMVDETNDTTGRAGESNQPQNAADEPRILEEHIVVPAQPVKPAVSVNTQDTPPSQNPRKDAPELNPPVTVPQGGIVSGIGSDISRLLQGIKLPARKESEVTRSETPKQVYDTSLLSTTKTKEQKEAEGEQVLAVARTMGEALAQTPKTTDGVRPLHTLKDDLQDVVRDKKISLVRAVALEEEKRHHGTASEAELEVQIQKKHRTRFGIFIALTFIILGFGALAAVLYVMQERNQKNAAPLVAQILFAEQSVPLIVSNITATDIRRTIASARNSTELTLGGILQIVPLAEEGETRRAVTFSEFMKALDAHAPSDLYRALHDPFFIGLHTVDENAPVIVVPVRSYELAFAGMLDWEKSMNTDLSPMFSAVPPLTLGDNGLPRERVFEDTVMSNYDVRILRDEAGVIQLYYSFPTRNILIIAESPFSFSELLSRLRADRKL